MEETDSSNWLLDQYAEVSYKCRLCNSVPVIVSDPASFIRHIEDVHHGTNASLTKCHSCHLLFVTNEDKDVHTEKSHPGSSQNAHQMEAPYMAAHKIRLKKMAHQSYQVMVGERKHQEEHRNDQPPKKRLLSSTCTALHNDSSVTPSLLPLNLFDRNIGNAGHINSFDSTNFISNVGQAGTPMDFACTSRSGFVNSQDLSQISTPIYVKNTAAHLNVRNPEFETRLQSNFDLPIDSQKYGENFHLRNSNETNEEPRDHIGSENLIMSQNMGLQTHQKIPLDSGIQKNSEKELDTNSGSLSSTSDSNENDDGKHGADYRGSEDEDSRDKFTKTFAKRDRYYQSIILSMKEACGEQNQPILEQRNTAIPSISLKNTTRQELEMIFGKYASTIKVRGDPYFYCQVCTYKTVSCEEFHTHCNSSEHQATVCKMEQPQKNPAKSKDRMLSSHLVEEFNSITPKKLLKMMNNEKLEYTVEKNQSITMSSVESSVRVPNNEELRDHTDNGYSCVLRNLEQLASDVGQSVAAPVTENPTFDTPEVATPMDVENNSTILDADGSNSDTHILNDRTLSSTSAKENLLEQHITELCEPVVLVSHEPEISRNHLLELIQSRVTEYTDIVQWGAICDKTIQKVFPHVCLVRHGQAQVQYYSGVQLRNMLPKTVDHSRTPRNVGLTDRIFGILPEILVYTRDHEDCVARTAILGLLSEKFSQPEVFFWGPQCNKAFRELFPGAEIKRKGTSKSYYCGVRLLSDNSVHKPEEEADIHHNEEQTSQAETLFSGNNCVYPGSASFPAECQSTETTNPLYPSSHPDSVAGSNEAMPLVISPIHHLASTSTSHYHSSVPSSSVSHDLATTSTNCHNSVFEPHCGTSYHPAGISTTTSATNSVSTTHTQQSASSLLLQYNILQHPGPFINLRTVCNTFQALASHSNRALHALHELERRGLGQTRTIPGHQKVFYKVFPEQDIENSLDAFSISLERFGNTFRERDPHLDNPSHDNMVASHPFLLRLKEFYPFCNPVQSNSVQTS